MTDFNFTQRRLEQVISLEVDFNFGANIHRLLEGVQTNFTAIWAESDASRNSGKVFIASNGIGAALSVVDMELKLLYDRYTSELKGRSDDLLSQEDLKDIVT
jgi:hypothetical protein